MGESCTLLERGVIYAGIWWGILRERGHFIDPEFYECECEYYFNIISGSGRGGMDWIVVALNRVELGERMNAVKNLGFHKEW